MVDDVLRSLAIISGVKPRIMQRVNDFRVVEELVFAGIGAAILPRYTRTVRDLIRRPLGGVQVARRIEAVMRAGAPSRPAVAAVVDVLEEAALQTVDPYAESSDRWP